MKEISVYKLSSGELVEDKNEAIKKENEFIFKKQFEILLEQEVMMEDDQYIIKDFVISNISELKNLFNIL